VVKDSRARRCAARPSIRCGNCRARQIVRQRCREVSLETSMLSEVRSSPKIRHQHLAPARRNFVSQCARAPNNSSSCGPRVRREAPAAGKLLDSKLWPRTPAAKIPGKHAIPSVRVQAGCNGDAEIPGGRFILETLSPRLTLPARAGCRRTGATSSSGRRYREGLNNKTGSLGPISQKGNLQ